MYFVTTLDVNDHTTRCVGYFSTFEKAEDLVTHNYCDINETCYKYAIIENIPEGIYQYDYNPTWYKYNALKDEYERCEKPVRELKFDNAVGYAIG